MSDCNTRVLDTRLLDELHAIKIVFDTDKIPYEVGVGPGAYVIFVPSTVYFEACRSLVNWRSIMEALCNKASLA